MKVHNVLKNIDVQEEHKKNAKSPNPECVNNGYLYKNYYTPFQGIGIFFSSRKRFFWRARLECEIVGEKDLIEKKK